MSEPVHHEGKTTLWQQSCGMQITVVRIRPTAMPRGPWPKVSTHLPAAGPHAKRASAKNLQHTCLPQGAMPRGPQPKIFGTLACHRSPCQGGLGQKSSAHLPATGHHAEGASAKNLQHTCLLQGAILRGPWPKIFGTLACCMLPTIFGQVCIGKDACGRQLH